MATVQDAVYDRLTTFAGLTALVSLRSHPLGLPQDEPLPAVWYRLVSANRVSAMGADTGNVESVVEVNAVDTTPSGASTVGTQVRAAMQRWSGTHATVVIDDSAVINQRAFFEDDREVYRELHEFRIWSKE